jgi:hypothetical protein
MLVSNLLLTIFDLGSLDYPCTLLLWHSRSFSVWGCGSPPNQLVQGAPPNQLVQGAKVNFGNALVSTFRPRKEIMHALLLLWDSRPTKIGGGGSPPNQLVQSAKVNFGNALVSKIFDLGS